MCYSLCYCEDVKRDERTKEPKIKKEKEGAGAVHQAAKMMPVRDSRNRKVPGLWIRNTRYYLQCRIKGERSPRRVPLQLEENGEKRPVRTLQEAYAARDKFNTERYEGDLEERGRKPTLQEAVDKYLLVHRTESRAAAAKLQKQVAAGQVNVGWPKGVWKPAYLYQCTRILGGSPNLGEEVDPAAPVASFHPARGVKRVKSWVDYLGSGKRVNLVTASDVENFMQELRGRGISNSTINMYLTVFRHFMTQLVLEGKVREHQHPTRRHKNKAPTPAKKEFLEPYQVDRLVQSAERYMQHGVALGQLIRLLALSGMRKNEAMRLRWEHVDFERGNLLVGMDGMAKNSTARKVPLTFERLRQHLEHMHETRDPFSPWLFPSPKRGRDPQHGPWLHPYRSWKKLRELAAKPDPDYPEDFDQSEAIRHGWKRLAGTVIHELRSHFISVCVTSGVNYLTLARWVGHRDGGVLIGKVYGKTTEEQDREFARMVQQPGLTVVEAAAGQ